MWRAASTKWIKVSEKYKKSNEEELKKWLASQKNNVIWNAYTNVSDVLVWEQRK